MDVNNNGINKDKSIIRGNEPVSILVEISKSTRDYVKPLETSKGSSRIWKDVNYVVDQNVVARSNYNAKDEDATGGQTQQQEAQNVYQ